MNKNLPKKTDMKEFYTLEEASAGWAKGSKVFEQESAQELSRLRLAREIRKARLAKKLTQKQVAAKAGMPQSAIARMESGTHSVSVDTLERVARVFGKKVQLV